jgi:hypothetical protein
MQAHTDAHSWDTDAALLNWSAKPGQELLNRDARIELVTAAHKRHNGLIEAFGIAPAAPAATAERSVRPA